jgi:hypothetical protein
MAKTALDARGAAEYLGICLSKVQRLSHAGLIPCRNINPGGRNAVYRYSPAALDQWLAGDNEGDAPKVLPRCSRPSRRVRECT